MSARRWYRPSLLAITLTLLASALFVALGVWQLGRAQQKENLLAAFAAAAQEAPHVLAPAHDAADVQHFPHVRVTGHFLPERAYLLDEKVHEGRLGVHAIGVFVIDGESSLLLVDRGWIAWNHASGTVPPVPPPSSDGPDGHTQLSGIYAPFPGSGLRIGGDALQRQTSWPKLTLVLDAATTSADMGRPVLPRLLLLDPAPDSGFVREWTPNVMPPARHLAYAVQWFALALAALAAFTVIHWRKVEE